MQPTFDKTTQLFSEYAKRPGDRPLSSTGPKHAPSLERGKACLVCRSRKVKCDGVKPTCGACARSAKAHGEDPSTVVCDFTDPPRRKRPAPDSDEVAELKRKIAELEDRLTANTALPPLPAVFPTPPESSSSSSAAYDRPMHAGSSAYSLAQQSLLSRQALSVQSSGAQGRLRDVSPSFDFNTDADPSSFNFDLSDTLSKEISDVLESGSLFYLGWPANLPPAPLLDRLLRVYFSGYNLFSDVIVEQRFKERIALPPTHARFHLPVLIHAVMALAGTMVNEEWFSGEARYWPVGEKFHEFHARQAHEIYQSSVPSGDTRRLLDLVQAIVLMSGYNYMQANWNRVWFQLASGIRLSVVLGLNHARLATRGPDGTLRSSNRKLEVNMLPPTEDAEELHERQTTFYAAFTADRVSSISTNRPVIMQPADITTVLPALEHPDAETEDRESIDSSLSHHSPSYYIAHPPHLCGTLQLMTKALMLTGQVSDFIQRAPEPIGNSIPQTLVEGAERPDLRKTEAFRRLDSTIKQFAMSLPREYSTPDAVLNPDGRVAIVVTLPHVAKILLYERLCTMSAPDSAMATCIAAARAVMSTIYMLYSTSFEISKLTPFLNSCWVVVGRTLVRELALKNLRQDATGKVELVSDVNILICAMQASQSPLGDLTARSLSAMLAHPERCLPDLVDSTSNSTTWMAAPSNYFDVCGTTWTKSARDPFSIHSPAGAPSSEGSTGRFQHLSPDGLEALLGDFGAGLQRA